MPLEVRWDPLTGQSCRVLPAGSLPRPEQQDLDALAVETRPTCPFCAERVETATPRFPPELCAEGRVRCGEAVLFPNLAPYAKWNSVSVYSPDRHLLRIDELTPPLVADNLRAQAMFARAVLGHDRSSRWVSVNANQLPPSGSSIFHPHLQGSANPEPTNVQRLVPAIGAARLREYVDASCSADDHDRAGCVLGDAVRCGAEQAVADEVATVAEHDEVVAAFFCDA